ncbi:hypothetical protein ACFPER_12065 [Agromyces aurantiacus]|uniref:DUF3077 domain-containing protein n=1 Tax=Agromyces aurantiacus TaxID=165814 RepID=A0ABV9R8D7_9MICO|nr:hypothetical protein [Agromyces aurantiacus]MBM7504216.1 hypothetical protein [Agromyces aurantiacus]
MSELENMTRAEALQAAADSFLHAERVCLDASSDAAPRDGALFYMSDALGSIAYGLKILTAAIASEDR